MAEPLGSEVRHDRSREALSARRGFRVGDDGVLSNGGGITSTNCSVRLSRTSVPEGGGPTLGPFLVPGAGTSVSGTGVRGAVRVSAQVTVV